MALSRYFNKMKDTVGSVLAYPWTSRRKKEAKGFENMSKLIRYKRTASSEGTDYKSSEFRKRTMASNAEFDVKNLSNEQLRKEARRVYSKINVD